MSEPVLLVERDGPVAILTLNRPQRMNALSRELRAELADAVLRLENDPEVSILILTGAGEKAFTAGLDLKELGESEDSALADVDAPDRTDPVRALAKFTGPVIGAINGVAITGGFELAIACDVLIASTNARFADTHARVGIMPGWGLSQKLSRLIGISRAKELSFTGNFLSAEGAYDWGLVNRVVAPEDLMPLARALAADMATIDPTFLKRYRRLIDEGYATTFERGMTLEQEASREANAAVSGADIEARRRAVQERGREQSGGE
ncbi:MAG: enoyl-CoA hydratase [Alphaproteobacteria bacterium]